MTTRQRSQRIFASVWKKPKTWKSVVRRLVSSRNINIVLDRWLWRHRQVRPNVEDLHAAAVAVLCDRHGGRRRRLAGNRRRVGLLLVPGRRRRPVRQPPLQLRGELSGVDRRPDGSLPVPGPLRSLRRHGRRRRAVRRQRSRLRQRLWHETGRLPRITRNTNQIPRSMWSVHASAIWVTSWQGGHAIPGVCLSVCLSVCMSVCLLANLRTII